MIGLKLAHKQADRASKRPRQQSIKRRVIRLVLIPSVVAVILWLVASGYLVFAGFYNREVANGVRRVSIPAVPALASIQQERRLSVAYLAQPSKDLRGLLDQRQQTDQRLGELRAAADSALANAPASISTRWETLTGHLDQLPGVRSMVDSRSSDGQRVYDSYNELLDAATDLFDTQARVVPDVTATQGAIAATETFRASDLMSRAGSIVDGAFGAGSLGSETHLEFVGLVGAYRSGLANVAPHVRPEVRKRYEDLVASDSWKALVAAENAVIADGAWRDGVPRNVPVTGAGWETLTRQVSDELINLTVMQADEASAQALRTGNNQLLTASLGSLLALSIAIAAIVWAVRQSQVLVDQALSVRLGRLGRDAAAVVDERLPDMMDRLRRREKVDLAVELPSQDYGSDEIGQVAEVLNRSLEAAVAAAVGEAQSRAAGIAMLMGVARRPQRPLQHGLKVVEDLQGRMGDEKLLAELFDIHHQMTQTRRFLENLVVLSGGQIGRRFHNPVPLRRVLLAAFAETQHYQRVTLRGAPDVALAGRAVAGTVHLLAELLDNALVFSPPSTRVWVTCNAVRHGVAVEIEDAGVGIKPEALERANELLATAPTPDVTALKDGAQVGLWVVAELAKRDGVQVSLRTSAYGGLLAIVFLPDRVIAADLVDPAELVTDVAAPATGSPSASLPDGAGRHGSRPTVGSSAVGVVTVTHDASARALSDPRSGEDRRPDRASDGQPNSGAGIPQQRESSPERVVGTSAPTPHGTARPPLPHRQPQQHLVPALRTDGPGIGSGDTAAPATSPEQARDRLAKYQRGWAAGQAAGNDDAPTSDDQDGKP
jgi:signal transduction histidine kinase